MAKTLNLSPLTNLVEALTGGALGVGLGFGLQRIASNYVSGHGVELELTVWMSDPAVGEADLKSAIFKDLLRRFRQGG